MDLYRLIVLAGYRLIYVDEIDPGSDDTYIVTILSGETLPGWPGARARIVLYDLEWHIEGIPHIPGLSGVWAADAWYAPRIGARYVPLGSHPGLPLSPKGEREALYDVCMLAYLSPRRYPIYNVLRDNGLRIAPDGQGAARDDLLWRSRLMLHVHQLDGVGTVAPQRFAIAAAYKLPLLAEWAEDFGVFRDGPVVWARYGNLAEHARTFLRASDLVEYGEALHEWLCVRHGFKRCIEEAL